MTSQFSGMLTVARKLVFNLAVSIQKLFSPSLQSVFFLRHTKTSTNVVKFACLLTFVDLISFSHLRIPFNPRVLKGRVWSKV